MGHQNTFDLIIRGGRVVDGTGNPWFEADVGIKADRIVAMGNLRNGAGTLEIDARGLVVAPGLVAIRPQTLSDDALDPLADHLVRQGVTLTTILGGTDLVEGDPEPGVMHRAPLIDLHQLPQSGGVHAVRLAIAHGAFGLHCGQPVPGAAPTNRMSELADVIARHGGFLAFGVPWQNPFVDEAVAEAITVSEYTDVRVHLFNLEGVALGGLDHTQRILQQISAARERGLEITGEILPWSEAPVSLDSLVPTWAREGGPLALLSELENPAIRDHLRRQMLNEWSDLPDWSRIHVNGYDLPTMAQRLSLEPIDLVLHLLGNQGGGVTATLTAADPSGIEAMVTHPLIMSAFSPLPTTEGALARLNSLYVNGRGVIRLEDAIRKLTSLPAGLLGLWDRGILRPGMMADVICLDPSRLTLGRSALPWVVVSGHVVIAGGDPTGEKPGRSLRHSSPG